MKRYILLFIIDFILNIACGKEIFMGDNWIVKNENGSVELDKVDVPSTVYNLLEKKGLTESVLYSKNDVNLRYVGDEAWIYELKFSGSELFNYTYTMLTFHGVDTIAEIYLNNEFIGSTNNMFVRYTFDIKKMLNQNDNKLTVKFASPIKAANSSVDPNDIIPPECPPNPYNGVCHMNMLRKMQASFSWDWGPAVPTVGLWKPVVFDLYNTAIIRDITYKQNEYIDHWRVDVKVFFELGKKGNEKVNGQLLARIVELNSREFILEIQIDIEIVTDADGQFQYELEMVIPKHMVELWWPNEYGSQRLYSLNVKFEDNRANDVSNGSKFDWRSEKSVTVGFRTIDLIEEPLADGNSFYFKVNGVPIFMKGSNYIPASIHPELSYNKEKVMSLMRAAKDAHMNMLRVWGGGLYESEYFYSLADEYGILIWHDMMFACAMYPAKDEFLQSVRAEVQQNIRRLQYHPSIAIWATNNENEAALRQNWYGTAKNFNKFVEDYQKLYIETVKDEAMKNDPARIVLNSSPSNGLLFENEVINKNPQDPHYGDIHFYNYFLNLWQSWIYQPARFISEYGFQSFPSLRSWEDIRAPTDQLKDLIDHRQHFPYGSIPITLLIGYNLPNVPNDEATKIYFSQINQAMAVKIQTNVYRAERGRPSSMYTMGALYWQLNDVWTAPSWSSIEFSGRHKILHNYIEEIFRPEQVIGLFNKSKTIEVFVLREKLNTSQNYTLITRIHRFSDLNVVMEDVDYLVVEPNTVKLAKTIDIYDLLEKENLDYRSHIVKLILKHADDDETVLSTDYVLLTEPKKFKDVGDAMIEHKISVNQCVGNQSVATIDLRILKPALFVYLEVTKPDITEYKFSSNGFIQVNAIETVKLEFKSDGCANNRLSASDIKILTVNDFM